MSSKPLEARAGAWRGAGALGAERGAGGGFSDDG